MTILVRELRAEIEQFKVEIARLEKSLKLVQSHANTAYTRGRQAGIADQAHTAREAMVAMNLARNQMMDGNERFTDLLEKAEQERNQLKAENAELKADAERFQWLIEHACAGSIGFGDGWINADEPPAEWRAAIDHLKEQ